MKTIRLGAQGPAVSAIGLGMMRLPTAKSPDRFLRAAMDAGFTFFDHADIYGGGESERIFGRVMQDVPRESYILQSKCGIRKGYYDLSKVHILSSVDGILERLRTEYLDVLLLHRPDALMEPQEIAGAFDALRAAGKVRWFGVSNMSPGQMELIGSALSEPLVVSQMQMSLAACPMVDFGLRVNTMEDAAVSRDGGVLDWCRLHGVTVQAWSPLQYGFFDGTFLDSPLYGELNAHLRRVGEAHGVSPTAVALAWLMRHGVGIQPIVGTTNPERLEALTQARSVELGREDWYALYRAAGKTLP